jgi:hypothetical protein
MLVKVGKLQAFEWRMNLLDFDLVLIPFPRWLTLPFIVQELSTLQGN